LMVDGRQDAFTRVHVAGNEQWGADDGQGGKDGIEGRD
jgi:hypothetical protein